MAETNERYDILIVPHNRALKLANGAGGSLIRFMAVTRLAMPTDEAVAETWAEVYCAPGPASHEIFVKGAYTDDAPVFEEMRIRFGKKPIDPGYEGSGPVYCCIEIRGAAFESPLGSFRRRIQEMLYFRPVVLSRPASGEPFEHLEVPEDEQPKEKKKKGSDIGRAGTSVEEF